MDLPTITVPEAVRRVAAETLELHRSYPLPVEQEVSGIALAERLAAGTITVQDVAALARFFRVNARHFDARVQECKTSRVDGLCRSWMLRGGDHGKVWAERREEELVRAGALPEDAYAALLAADPDEIYARFAAGAFRWEYGLDTPALAAKFYEDYHRATGQSLDLDSAFGESGRTIANAITRRTYGPDPFAKAKRALQFECAEYRLAAMVDLQELNENIKPFLFSKTPGTLPKSTIQLVWPVFVAYAILATERPELLVDLHASSAKPPTLQQEPKALLHYCDAVRIFVSFFHPQGSLFVPVEGTKFEDLPSQLEDFMLRAHLGKKLVPSVVQKMLGAARRWTAENKMAGSLFHIYNADWRKGNWASILEDLPPDSDVYGPFSEFVKAAPVPAAGVKLQQTLSDKKQLAAIAQHFSVSDPDELDQRKVGVTPFGLATAKLGRPVGVYSVIKTGIIERTLLGCFDRPEGWVFVLQRANGQIESVPIDYANDQLNTGNWTVTKAHKDMKLGYNAAAPVPSAIAMAKPKQSDPDGPAPAITKGVDPQLQTGADPVPLATLPPAPAPGLITPLPPASVPEPFAKFAPDDVVQVGDVHYWVAGVVSGGYRVVSLFVDDKSIPVFMDAATLEAGKLKGNYAEQKALAPFITMTGGKSITTTGSVSVGEKIGHSHIAALFVFAGGEIGAVVFVPGLRNFSAVTVPAVVSKSSYAPPSKPPADKAANDAKPLCGTEEAIAFMLKHGFEPVDTNATVFYLHLAGVYQYGAQLRTIMGVCKKDEAFYYIIRTQFGKLNYKGKLAGEKDYKPFVEFDSAVYAALKGVPGAKPADVSVDLGYRVAPAMQALVEASKLKLVPAPFTFLKPGIQVEDLSGVVRRFVGFVKTSTGGTGLFLVDEASNDWTVATQLPNWKPHYTASTSVTDISKKSTSPFSLKDLFAKPHVVLPSSYPDGWMGPAAIKEPTVPKVPADKHVAVAVLLVLPAGATLQNSGSAVVTDFPSVMLFKPLKTDFSYKLAIPRGYVQAGESMLSAAVWAVHGSLALSCKPTAFLGDFASGETVTRVYVGYATGGDPRNADNAQSDCDQVAVRTLVNLQDSGFTKQPWWNDLAHNGGGWQQNAILALRDFLVANGMPHTYVEPDAPAQSGQVTFKDDKAAPASATAPSGGSLVAADAEETDIWKSLLFKSPFPVTTAMIVALQAKVKSGAAAAPKSFNASRSRAVGPKFGESFETAQGTPFVAAGYVSWAGEDGANYHYLLGLSGAGLVEVLPAGPDGAQGFKVTASDTMSPDPWFSHPDPAVMARIKIVHETGSLSAAKVNMATFKLSWLKEAGVPYYAVASLSILTDLAGLFVPGALTEAQKNAVIACLKSRMAATQSGKSKGSAAVATAATPAPAAPVAPKSPGVVHDTPLIAPSAFVTLENPSAASLKKVKGKTVTTSSKPSAIMADAQGNRFFVKWREGSPWQAEVDKVAALLMARVKKNVVPVNTFDLDRNRASIQPLLADAAPTPSNPNDLSDANKAELLSQHAFDMFVGDHDGHGGNWIQVGSKLIAVDRGQAFKFILQGTPESLDPSWHAPGNFGDGYAKRLLLDWSQGKAEIPQSAFAAMRSTILNVQNEFVLANLEPALAPVFASLKLSAGGATNALSALESRRKSYLDDWTKVLLKLRSDFTWPGAAGGLAIGAEVFKATPKDLDFGQEEDKLVTQAASAGWQGKSVRVDGPWIENQEVMCRAVMWEVQTGQVVPATLIHFRLTKNAGLRATQVLLASGMVDVSGGPGGPQRLLVDKANSIYEKLFAAIKSINFHLTGPKADGIPNAVTVEAAVSLRPMLLAILESTKKSGGKFEGTGEPNDVVNAMADQYLGYISTIEYWASNASTLLGKHSPQFTEFVYEEPPTDKPKPKPKSFKITLKNQGASYPNITNDAGKIVVRNLHKPVVNSSQVGQFVIEDPASGARVFFNPTASSGDIKAGIQGVKGLCWGVIPGELSTHTLAHLLKLFGEATSIPTARATEKDRTLLYLAKQAAALQGDGSFSPTSDGTALVEPELVSAYSAYEQGNVDGARDKLVALVAQKAGMPPKDVLSAAMKQRDGLYDARDAGFYRHTRIGWDVDRLKKVLGGTSYVTHALLGHSSVKSFLGDVSVNGALLANEIKPFYGVVKEGASPSSDFSHGGSQGVFCCIRKGGFHPKHLYFDLSLALRLDVYMIGTGDSFGDVHTTRYMSPEKWTVGSGKISASSGGQIVVRHDIDLQTYLVVAKCADEVEAQACIALVKKLGWKFRAGPPEKIFIA